MKIDRPENSNYAAVVVRLKAIVPLAGRDNIVGTPLFGYQAIVSKDNEVGKLGLFFPAETQLSDEYTHENNLYRHSDLNNDKTQKGYIEDNRRIRAVRFGGHVSNCLFMPVESLAFTGIDVSLLNEGDEFDNLNGHEICKKYVSLRNPAMLSTQQSQRKFERVDKKHMPEHFDTLNFFKFMDTIPLGENLVITQKLHGTSIRIGHTIVKRKLSMVERIAKFFGASITRTEYDYVFGSRKVIKDSNNPDQNHFYETDIWTTEGKKLAGLLPKGYLVYAELIGYTADGAPIQKGYTYNLPVGTCEMFIYRVASVNEDGHLTELTWDGVVKFCKDNGLKHVPELVRGHREPEIESGIITLMDMRYFESGFRNAIYLGQNDLVDEGVCIRSEHPVRIYKAKSPKFLEHETKILDEGIEDLESTQNES